MTVRDLYIAERIQLRGVVSLARGHRLRETLVEAALQSAVSAGLCLIIASRPWLAPDRAE
jgi:hypothetical protein